MPGGLIQLSASGAENDYIITKPQITFFKSVFKRHTNFSIETIDIQFPNTGDILDISRTIFKTKVPRNGDLMSNLAVVVDIPDIISNKYKDFRWVPNLGEALIHRIAFYIAGQKIEELDSNWLNIYSNTHLSEGKRKLYNNLICNTPEFTDPELEYYNNTNNIYYPPYNNTTNNMGPFRPSIVGKQLYIPIPFWFTREIGLAVPIIGLQYHEIEVEVEFRALSDLFTVNYYNNSVFQKRSKPFPDNNEKLVNFVYNSSIDYTAMGNTFNTIDLQMINRNNAYNLNPRLAIDYIFLGEDERMAFAKMTHEYVIRKVNRTTLEGLSPSSFHTPNLYHPMSEIFWVYQRSDVDNRNDWHNYSNLLNEKKSFYCNENQWLTNTELTDLQTSIIQSNWNKFNPEILNTAKIQFNNQDRIDNKNGNYFSNYHSYLYHSNGNNYIYNYSFAVDPEKYQPTGSVNMTGMPSFSLISNTITPYSGNYSFNLYMYHITYNVLKIMGGMGSLGFSI
tara:strand:+ start:587 stop:2101 length:1515 start_codon:yes stop_codon:yes gene_type:complete